MTTNFYLLKSKKQKKKSMENHLKEVIISLLSVHPQLLAQYLV